MKTHYFSLHLYSSKRQSYITRSRTTATMPSKHLFSLLPCLRKEQNYALRLREEEKYALDNGSILLEDLIASCDGKSHPIRHYSAHELIRATNNFDPVNRVGQHPHYVEFKGLLDNRTVIIKRMLKRDQAIRDIIISIQMSSHKNVLKLLGCCLEFPVPALVLEYAANGVLGRQGGYGVNEYLPWKTRLRIAKQVANAITYLHTAFPRPIIHGDLRMSCIFLDHDSAPKLGDFSHSVTIPPEQLHVNKGVEGTVGYIDTEYAVSGIITLKTDVYSFGVILLVLLTGRCALDTSTYVCIVTDVKSQACDGQFQTIVDPRILGELGGEVEQAQKQQLHDFLALALLCVRGEREARPDMIDVAKELVRIDKSIITF